MYKVYSERRERDTLTSLETAMYRYRSLCSDEPLGFSSLGIEVYSERRERDSNPRTAYAV